MAILKLHSLRSSPSLFTALFLLSSTWTSVSCAWNTGLLVFCYHPHNVLTLERDVFNPSCCPLKPASFLSLPDPCVSPSGKSLLPPRKKSHTIREVWQHISQSVSSLVLSRDQAGMSISPCSVPCSLSPMRQQHMNEHTHSHMHT